MLILVTFDRKQGPTMDYVMRREGNGSEALVADQHRLEREIEVCDNNACFLVCRKVSGGRGDQRGEFLLASPPDAHSSDCLQRSTRIFGNKGE